MQDNNKPVKNKNVFFVGCLSFFGGISQDIFSPIFPIYLTTVLGFDKAFVGIAEGVVVAGAQISKIVAGYVSDRFQKQKPIIFIGYFFSMIGRLFLVFFSSFGAILGLRLIDGVGKGVKDPAKDVLIAGSSKKETRGKSFGVARMLDTLGSVVGPLVLFGLLSFFQDSPTLYHNLLLFCAIPLFITLGILVFRVKEIPRESFENKQSVSGGGPLGSSFYLFLFIVALFTLGNSSDAFLILRAKNLGITLLEIPLVVALFNVVYALFAVPFGSLSDKIGRIPTMLIGWLAYALVYVGFAITHSSFSVWFLYAFYGVYYATNEGVAKAFLADLVDPSHRGRAFGLYGVVIGLTTLPASFLAGYLWDRFGPAVPFYFGSFLALFAAFLLLVFSRRLKPLRF